MAKNEPKLDTVCPRCGKEGEMEVDVDLKLSSNVTVLRCNNPERDELNFLICDHAYAKDQSVKLSGSLVLEAAECMEEIGGYSSLGEFVRECIRVRISGEQQRLGAIAIGRLMAEATKDPETMRRLLEDD